MPTDDIPMPSTGAVRRALRETTERIAAELASPSSEAPDWSEFEWRVAMAVAVMHGVSALLAGRLRWQGAQVWNKFLAEQKEQGKLRLRRTRQLLSDIDAAAKLAQVPLVALKGSALLDLELYAAGERPMSDIDLLSFDRDMELAGRLIESIGFAEGLTTWREREYLPLDTSRERVFGEHIDNPVKIELHGRILEHLPVRDTVITEEIIQPDAKAGLNRYPSLGVLMRHLLLHAAGNMCFQGVRLIHLHDISVLAERLSVEDWRQALRVGFDRQRPWWMLPPLALVNKYFPGRIPTTVLSQSAALCPPLLRWVSMRYDLVHVSLSKLGTPLLPGLEWSGSVTEACTCIAARIYPGREVSAFNEKIASRQHAVLGSTWAGQTRFQRALRLALGQAQRPQTLYSIRQALIYSPASRPC